MGLVLTLPMIAAEIILAVVATRRQKRLAAPVCALTGRGVTGSGTMLTSD